ncbi:MAG: hypothetical protein M8350_03295 [Methanosarcinaceae archaeon]|nr:hypothetical protein [Methanosarcinaceae archaeon]
MNDNINDKHEMIGFKDQITEIQTAIDSFRSGQKKNIAIIAEPFGGKTTLLNEIEKNNPLYITKVSLSSIVKDISEIKVKNENRIMIFDHCEFLYMGRIGGFDILDEFLKTIISSDKMFITTWNVYSWNYLDAAINIGKMFPIQIKLSKFSVDYIKQSLLSTYKEDEIQFVDDIAIKKDKLVKLMKYPLNVMSFKKPINIPYIKINRNILKIRLSKKKENITVQDIIFEKINHISNGNPGIAEIVWKKSIQYPLIKPSWINEFSFNIDLNYDEAFILSIILSMKSIKREDLVKIIGSDFRIDFIIFTLLKQDLITAHDDDFLIRPEAFKSVVLFLNKLRLVW